MHKKVAAGTFVRRQTADSGYSHFDGTWEQLENLVVSAMKDEENIIPGYRDGVILVRLPHTVAPGFYSGTVKLTDRTKLITNYAPRREGEAPFIRVSAKSEKQSAKIVDIVCYRADVLAENDEQETDADWEIVAIKARHSLDEEPMDPYTMARNFLHLEGGTKGDFTAEQFAKSIVYWNNHVMSAGKSGWRRKIISFFKGKST